MKMKNRTNRAADIRQTAKLRTDCMYKSIYEAELYVYMVYNKAHISVLTQFRTRILHN